MGEPAYKKKEEFKKYNVNVFSTNFALYGDMSNRVMSILKKNSTILRYILLMKHFLIVMAI